jgi:hypothetical protein
MVVDGNSPIGRQFVLTNDVITVVLSPTNSGISMVIPDSSKTKCDSQAVAMADAYLVEMAKTNRQRCNIFSHLYQGARDRGDAQPNPRRRGHRGSAAGGCPSDREDTDAKSRADCTKAHVWALRKTTRVNFDWGFQGAVTPAVSIVPPARRVL